MNTFTFAELLRGFLSRATIKQAELAQALGVHRNTIGAWVRGEYLPETHDMVLRIEKELHLSPTETDQLLRAASFPAEHGTTTAAPPRTLHQLRAPVADFVGRTEEIAALTAALASGGGATISGLAGMGGIGKSELALVVGNRLIERYPDAQIVLNLQGSRDAALSAAQALQNVIRAFHDGQLPDDEPSLGAVYRSLLKGKRVLILADDAKDAAQIRPLLPPTGSALLVTSRQRFALPGMRRIDLERLHATEAVTLLRTICDRLSADEAAAIATACGRLPLALRIAGGVLANDETLGVASYLARLADEKRRLAALRDPDDHELDVEASLALSYHLLDATLQHTLSHLGVFGASFDLPAVGAVLDGVAQEALETQLGQLYRRSLIEFAQGRYDLHELVRAFALAHLGDNERTARLRHARHYIAVAEEAQQQFLAGGDSISVGLARFDRERANLDAARRWLQAHSGDVEIDELLLDDANATAHSGDLRYDMRGERIHQLEAAIAAAIRLGQYEGQGALLGNLGNVYLLLGETRKAVEFYQQTLALSSRAGGTRGEGSTLGNLGNAYLNLGDTPKAIALYEQSLAIARHIGERRDEGNALGNLGVAYSQLGDTNRAIGYYQDRLLIAREMGDRRVEGTTLGNLGTAYADLGQERQAIEFYQQNLVIARELGDRRSEGYTLSNLGTAHKNLGDVRKAVKFHEQALAIYSDIADRRGEGAALGNLGNAYFAIGDADTAREYHQKALLISQETEDRFTEAQDLGNLGTAYVALEKNTRAIELYQQQLTIARELGDRRSEGTALGNLGNAYLVLGDARQAIEFSQQALAIACEIGDRHDEGAALGNLGNAYLVLGDARQAIEFSQQALAIACEIGDRHDEGAALDNLGRAYLAMGDARQAIEFSQQALSIARDIGDRQGEAETGWNLGLLLARAGDVAQALPHLEASLTFHQAIGHSRATMMAEAIALLRQHGKLSEQHPTTATLPDDLPDAVRQALEAHGNAALHAALAALPEDEASTIVARLQEAGIISGGPDMAAVLREFDPLLRAIAAVATGDEGPRAQVVAALTQLEQGGWRLTDAVQRIWTGERDEETLSAGIDTNSATLVRRVLAIIAAPPTDTAPGSDPPGANQQLPTPIQAALADGDERALQDAIDALPSEERARVTELLRMTAEQAIARAQRRSPEAIVAGLPSAVRAALEQGEQAALNAALANLDDAAQQRTRADLADLHALSMLAAQEAQQRDPRERFAALLRDIARVAIGYAGPRAGVVQTLAQMEQSGWMLRGPVERIWQGERDRDTLVAGLDAQDTSLIERVLALVDAYERGARRTPAQVLAELPAPLRAAIEQQDEAAFNAALEPLDDDERARVAALLAELEGEATNTF
ncbi:MAG: tetratricopeptide repeat protein [Candidatus Viridilinea halotolerans]|uniref:Tetratricopeptide repeat protein n=1 Tax=Candidatus Viridilinea halotolerans TaxID=2491704 RepID=A0A426U1X8_9CHLR|nr:MAG: tetratricopeptide repeat protein [Candidatus Viridilinea halotolerans]